MDIKEKRESALSYLNQDKNKHIDMIVAIEYKQAEIIVFNDQGVVLFDSDAKNLMVSMRSLDVFKNVVDITKYDTFAIHQKEIASYVYQERRLTSMTEIYHAVYWKSDIMVPNQHMIRRLTPDYIEYIFDHYDGFDGRKIVEKLIDRHLIWGLFDDGELAGFIGEHLEGSMGLLMVFPKFRRKGYAYSLTANLIKHLLKQNRIPYSQIKPDNIASLRLHQNLNMDIIRKPVFWMS